VERPMRPWIGIAVAAVGVLHTLFGLVGFRGLWSELLREGLVNTVHGQPEREFAFWFLFLGIWAILLGALVHRWEVEHGRLPGFFGWSLLAITIAMLVPMPASGAWLLLVPAVGAIWCSRST
jgi:Family of unknown function (DUF6463)